MVRVKPIVGHVGSSTQTSLVNSRRTPLHDGQVPPTVHPLGITSDSHGLPGAPTDPFISGAINGLGFGQKQHCSPGEHLQSSLRCSWGQRWVQATTLSLPNKLAYNTNAKASKIRFMLTFPTQFCSLRLTLMFKVNQFTDINYMELIMYTRKDPSSSHLHLRR